MTTRRDFLKGLSSCVLLTSLTSSDALASNLAQAKLTVELNQLKIQIQNLPKAFENYRILFISDIHYGPFLPQTWFEQTIGHLKDQDYDLLILGGDYLSLPDSFLKRNIYPWHNQDFKLSDPLSKIKSMIFSTLCGELGKLKIKDGIIATYGNHDRWSAESLCYQSFRKIKTKFLVNKYEAIQRGTDQLLIYGVDDFWTGFPKINLHEFNKIQYQTKLIVSHNPDYISQIINNPMLEFDLALCGHTHGGQICLPGIGGLYYNIKDTRLATGLFQQGRRQVFTSNGIGTVELPYRLNCPPEVCLLELVST